MAVDDDTPEPEVARWNKPVPSWIPLLLLAAVTIPCCCFSAYGRFAWHSLTYDRESNAIKAREGGRQLLTSSRADLHVEGNDPALPASIRELEPRFVDVDRKEGTVRLTWGGGHIYPYGLLVFSDDRTPFWAPRDHPRKVTEGVWSFNEN
jgi:hypothetical protein